MNPEESERSDMAGYGGNYDSIVRWDKRLPREAPFFRQLFESCGVASLADVGCGTAKHAVMFAGWGIEVWALDPSEEMLTSARANIEESGSGVHLALAGFGEVASAVGEVDGVVCLGNAFMHAGDAEGVMAALEDFAAAIRPGGPLVIHMLNQDRIVKHGMRMLPSAFRSGGEGDTVAVKLIDHGDDYLDFEFVRLMRAERSAEADADAPSEWTVEAQRTRHPKILGPMLRRQLEAVGFGEIKAYGDHTGRTLDPDDDESAIWVAIRD